MYKCITNLKCFFCFLDILVMDTKNMKLKQEINLLSKEDDQYKRTLSNMRNTILKLNDIFSQNKGKSNQLLNENEWIQCSYVTELKVNINKNISIIILYFNI